MSKDLLAYKRSVFYVVCFVIYLFNGLELLSSFWMSIFSISFQMVEHNVKTS